MRVPWGGACYGRVPPWMVPWSGACVGPVPSCPAPGRGSRRSQHSMSQIHPLPPRGRVLRPPPPSSGRGRGRAGQAGGPWAGAGSPMAQRCGGARCRAEESAAWREGRTLGPRSFQRTSLGGKRWARPGGARTPHGGRRRLRAGSPVGLVGRRRRRRRAGWRGRRAGQLGGPAPVALPHMGGPGRAPPPGGPLPPSWQAMRHGRTGMGRQRVAVTVGGVPTLSHPPSWVANRHGPHPPAPSGPLEPPAPGLHPQVTHRPRPPLLPGPAVRCPPMGYPLPIPARPPQARSKPHHASRGGFPTIQGRTRTDQVCIAPEDVHS